MRPFFCITLSAVLVLAAAPAGADELSDLAALVRAESERVEQMTALHDRNRSSYERLAAAIRAAKRAGSLNPVTTATLQADLRVAYEQAVALQQANGALAAARQRLGAIVEQYRESLLARIEALQFELRQPSRASGSRREVERLTASLQGLAAPLPPMSESPVAAILEVDAPTPEQLHAASLELRDYRSRLERQLGEVRVRIVAEEKQGRLQSRLRAMASSDALFEDGFGSRSRTARSGAVAERSTPASTPMSGAAASDFSEMAADAAGTSAPSGPVTSAPGGAGSRVAVGPTASVSPVASLPAVGPEMPRALVDLRGREAALLRSLDEAVRAEQRLVEASAVLREAEREH